MVEIRSDIIERFGEIIAIDVAGYMKRYVSFVDTHLGSVIEFFKTSVISGLEPFNILAELTKEAERIDSAIVSSVNSMDGAEYWDIVSLLDDMMSAIETMNNSSKWMRSTIMPNERSEMESIDYVIPQRRTIESIARDNGYIDSDNSWAKIAVGNGLMEIDYSPSGGKIIKLDVRRANSDSAYDVVDTMIDDNILGKDINKEMRYSDDDLSVVVGMDCIVQSYEILLGLKRGDIPEFPELGHNMFSGGTLSELSYPAVLRQMQRTFSTDSSVESIGISGFNIEEDKVNIDVMVQSKFAVFLRKGFII